MSQFDKDDVEDLGLLKLDVLGIRMQSSMAHAVDEIRGTDGVEIDLDDEPQVPFDDPATYQMISRPRPSGCSRSSRPASASWSASPGSTPSRTSSPTSRCSGRGRSRAT